MKDNSIINGIIIKVITGEELTSAESTMYEEYIADEGNRRFVEQFKNDAEANKMLSRPERAAYAVV